jgi:hypothetical protein
MDAAAPDPLPISVGKFHCVNDAASVFRIRSRRQSRLDQAGAIEPV